MQTLTLAQFPTEFMKEFLTFFSHFAEFLFRQCNDSICDSDILLFFRSILAKGEGKKQTLHFMDMNPFHMQLLLQYMYRGEISVPQGELAPLMTSARSLQIKGLCNSATPATPMAPPQQPETDRLSEFANYLAANTQPQPLTSIMPPGNCLEKISTN